MSTVTSRWTPKLMRRRALLKAAQIRTTLARNALERARKDDVHPRGHLVTRLQNEEANLELRHTQVADAERILARARGASRTSIRGARLIASFEGGQSDDGMFRPYKDPVGVWTIGYGHTAGVGPKSKPLTRTQALELLRKDLDQKYGAAVAATCKKIGLKVNQNEFDALVSLVYNLGPGILDNGRTMGNALRAKRRGQIADAFLVYNKAGNPPRELLGLTLRRQKERDLFRNPH